MHSIFTILLGFLFLFEASGQQPTRVIIRAKAKDAKFIGSSMGGALVTIRDAQTGELLDQGITTGGTGDTERIMRTPTNRYSTLSDDRTAGFESTLQLGEPTKVRITVLAPANYPQAAVEASTEIWLLPGKHILGDGVTLEIPGFVVEILNPRTHQSFRLKELKEGIQVRANVVMMCGCTITDGGLWDANGMKAIAYLYKEGQFLNETPLTLKSPNLFEGNVAIGAPGPYQITLTVYDPKTGNTGVDKLSFVVTAKK